VVFSFRVLSSASIATAPLLDRGHRVESRENATPDLRPDHSRYSSIG